MWLETQVAKRLGFCLQWFRSNRETLEAQGFPKKDPLFKRWDSAAIERWLDERAGLIPRSPETTRRLVREAWHGGGADAIRHQ